MSKAPKKGPTKPSGSKGNKGSFFSETFGKKKITVRERRGGTAKERHEAYTQSRDEPNEGQRKKNRKEEPYDRKKSFSPDKKARTGELPKPYRNSNNTRGEKNTRKTFEQGQQRDTRYSDDRKKTFSTHPKDNNKAGPKPLRNTNEPRERTDSRKPFDRTRPGDLHPFPERKKSFSRDNKKEERMDRAQSFRPRDTTRGRSENAAPYDKKHRSEKRFDSDDKPFAPKRYAKFTDVITEEMPLNKYIAHSGICSRREAAEIVKQGKVKVNGALILEPGYKVQPTDVISMAGKKIAPVKDLAYVLLNKPKDFVTTTSDPEGRKTVMDLVTGTGVTRLYPIGRLDRNTTGVLLLTNDGALAQKLSHPKYNVKKIYQVGLDKPMEKADFEKLTEGIVLEDGEAKADAASVLTSPQEIGLEIHSGRNRIVRRMFEALGYDVVKLDRVMYAGLTKKNVSRGHWRFLTEKEIIFLKHFK